MNMRERCVRRAAAVGHLTIAWPVCYEYVLAISGGFPSFKKVLLSVLFICVDHCETGRRRKDGRLNAISLTATGE